jgi:pyruvate dehydrogenase E1 component beta subunit
VALEAAEKLSKEGIEAEVVDLRSLRPLDMGPSVKSFQKTFKAVIVEEGYRSYGIGAEVAARLQEEAFDYMDAPIKRVAQYEVPLPYSRDLEQMALINADRVIKAVKEVL